MIGESRDNQWNSSCTYSATGLKWRDAPKGYGPYKTLYSRFIRWSRMGILLRSCKNCPSAKRKS
ncbi:MAG: transposase [Puniceicoccales bacterium]|nr:transposase [Puniceicoccales bacterium]